MCIDTIYTCWVDVVMCHGVHTMQKVMLSGHAGEYNMCIDTINTYVVIHCRVSYRIFVWEGEVFLKDGKPKLNHALNAYTTSST